MKRNMKLLLAICPVIWATVACSTRAPQSAAAMERSSEEASKLVSSATEVVQNMAKEPRMADLLQNAEGLFIVPRYARAAFGVGGSGGEGILLVKQNGNWGDPAFYNFGGMSVGLQAGAEGGSVVYILNNQKAVQQFRSQNNFSLDANAGLTFVDWSRAAYTEIGRADVVAWSNNRGLFGGVAIGLRDAVFDRNETSGFYGRAVTVDEFFSGQLSAPQEKTAMLKQALSEASPRLSGGEGGSEY